MALPESETGKYNSGSTDRQAAADRQLSPAAGRAALAYPGAFVQPVGDLVVGSHADSFRSPGRSGSDDDPGAIPP